MCAARVGTCAFPPSQRADGAAYQWDPAGANQAVPAPGWLIELARSKSKSKKRDKAWARAALERECEIVAKARPGTATTASTHRRRRAGRKGPPAKPTVQPQQQQQSGRPTIRIARASCPRVVSEAEAALIAAGGLNLYQRGGLIVRPVLSKLNQQSGNVCMATCCGPTTLHGRNDDAGRDESGGMRAREGSSRKTIPRHVSRA